MALACTHGSHAQCRDPVLTTAGLVRLNGKRMTAAGHPVRIGDVVTLALDRAVKVVRVEGLCEKRGGAPAARTLYRELT